MITVPPATDKPDTAGNGRVVATVPVAHSPIDPRPYVSEIPDTAGTGGAPAEQIDDGPCTEEGRTAAEGGPCLRLDDLGAEDVDAGDDAEDLDDEDARAARPAAAGRTPPVPAGGAQRGMLLAHMEQGENVGLEIRHVEPYVDGTGVTVVMAGGHVGYFRVDDLLEVVDPDEACEARARLAAKQRTAGQVDVLRHIAALAEAGELPVPYHLRVEGDLPSLDLLHAAADMLGAEVVEAQPGFWRVDCRFGADDKYTAPVELSLTHYGSGR